METKFWNVHVLILWGHQHFCECIFYFNMQLYCESRTFITLQEMQEYFTNTKILDYLSNPYTEHTAALCLKVELKRSFMLSFLYVSHLCNELRSNTFFILVKGAFGILNLRVKRRLKCLRTYGSKGEEPKRRIKISHNKEFHNLPSSTNTLSLTERNGLSKVTKNRAGIS
jgi:hypothetical protein